ncbi:MAG TPA: S-layer homology domain-containing protein, partial [Chloroflexia bacterium]|nr:S-layer homology domain-containing protein [Chloroflexia bacterium]
MSRRIFGFGLVAFAFGLLTLAALLAAFSRPVAAQQVAAPAQAPAQAVSTRVPFKDPHQALGVWTPIATFPAAVLSPTPGTNPLKIKRGAAAAYPPNGKIYHFGGRHGVDGEDFALASILEYTPGNPGTWATKAAVLDGGGLQGSRFTSNMAAATIGANIYVIGGNSVDSVPISTTRVYNPVADSISTTDAWPASPVRVPGGWAVVNDKLYLFGGFSDLANGGTGGVFTDTWRFDPAQPAGSRWTQMAPMNLGRAFMGAAVVDGKIYAVGGDLWQGSPGTLVPVTNVERYDPATNTWTTMAPLPTARGDLGAWGYDTGSPYEIAGKVAVAGGHFPIPDNQGYIYTPATNTWTTFPNLVYATRNYAYTQLDGYLYALGGYDYTNGVPIGANFNQRYDATTAQGTPTSTRTGTPPTATSTSTGSATWTRTATATAVPTVCGQGVFSNPAAITINDAGPASPYPSNITVGGAGTIASISVSINGISHTWPDDVDMLLVGPNGGKVLLMSDAGGSNDIGSLNLTFQDGAPAIPDSAQITSGTYGPADYEAGDVFPAPAPAGPYGTSLNTAFVGSNANGTWSLYIVDDAGADVGNISGGWSLTIGLTGGCATVSATPVAPTATRTSTVAPSATTQPSNTAVPPTNTIAPPSATRTTAPPTAQPSATNTAAVPTTTPCPIQFTDVAPTDPFYPFIRCLACRGIISGYSDGTFRGGQNLTRGQASKMISNAAGFSDAVPSTQQSFQDVPMSDPFWVYIERLATRGYISGYQCGFPPAGNCVPPANRPYFLTYNNITRGQISKIVANAAGLNNAIPSTQRTFADVPYGNAFWIYIERLAALNVISGYNCGGPGEPCDGQNRPYYRW